MPADIVSELQGTGEVLSRHEVLLRGPSSTPTVAQAAQLAPSQVATAYARRPDEHVGVCGQDAHRLCTAKLCLSGWESGVLLLAVAAGPRDAAGY